MFLMMKSAKKGKKEKNTIEMSKKMEKSSPI